MAKRRHSEIEDIIIETIESIDIWKSMKNVNKKFISNNETDYVSGTTIKNYLLKDPMLDWLDLYYLKNGLDKKVKSKKRKTITKSSHFPEITNIVNVPEQSNFLNILFKNGNEFEDKIIKYLQVNFEKDIIIINKDGRKGYTRKNYNNTIKSMKKGIPIIAQGVLFNDVNKTCGIADLIVRSDYINKIIKREVIKGDECNFKAPNLDGNYHYRVIDIKWTTMTLCSNGYTIRNDDRIPAYKGQLAIYNCAIGEIQGYYPNTSYILAKAWKIDNKTLIDSGESISEGYNCFDLLGHIEYDTFDKQYIDKTKDAIDWIRNVRKNGKDWTPLKPEITEMYPNASNKNDAPWTQVKKDICDKIGEITQIWYVGDVNRNNAHKKGIFSWKDERCDSKILDIKGKIRPKIIDSILEINRSENKIMPLKIKNNDFNWHTESNVDFYVDFETINKCFVESDMNIMNSKTYGDIIFMIGVGYIENKCWKYVSFIAESIELADEYKIIDQFTKFINEKSIELDSKISTSRLFHWSQAEITNFKHACKRHNAWHTWHTWYTWDPLDQLGTLDTCIEWVDMYNIFIKEPIIVKGALNFKLKDIAKAMYKLKLINTCWDDEIKDGLSAMISAIDFYNGKNKKIMKDITNYNEVDCKVVYEIVEYLRNTHI